MTAQPQDRDAPVSDRVPPHDVTAEQCALGGMLLSKAAIDDVLDVASAADFYRPAHQAIFATILALREAGEPTDVVTVAAELMASGQISRIGGAPYLHTLIASVPTAANAGYYARIVSDRALLRRLTEVGARVAQMGYSPGGETARDVVGAAVEQILALRDHGLARDDVGTLTAGEFLAVDDVYDWLVPGLLEKTDRLMLTGPEGGGKSMLIRQIAVCVASGLHPFRIEPIDPHLVLVVDCENGPALVRRRLRHLVQCAGGYGVSSDDMLLWIETRPEGLDLLRAEDARWLLKRVEQIRPSLLCIGPVYKLHSANPNEEEPARKVAKVLDQVRAMGCALVIETHAGHGSGMLAHRPVRPAGASLWLRWPEFGYGLRLADDDLAAQERRMDLVAWRGPRDEREWPKQLVAGEPWPWVAAPEPTWGRS